MTPEQREIARANAQRIVNAGGTDAIDYPVAVGFLSLIAQVEALTRKEKALQGLADLRYSEVLELTAQLSEALTVPQGAAAIEEAPATWPELMVQIRTMRAIFHVNMLRAYPHKTHDEIAAEIDRALDPEQPRGGPFTYTVDGVVMSPLEYIEYMHRQYAGERLRADQGWERYESANRDRNALRAALAAPTIPAIPGTKEGA